MLNDDLEIYDSCDLDKPNIPPRSRLYHLEPIGIGTPYVESLTSYIARLSEAHSVTPTSLFSQIIGYESKQTFIKNCSSRNIGTLFKRSRFVNGHGKIVQDIYQSLKNLTLRQNLDYLTVFRYSTVLSTRKLFKQNKSWCPACYEQWRLSNHTVYEPLLWTLEDVEICPHHYQPLQNSCPYCNQSSTWLSSKSRVGYCCKCDHWLGSFSQVNRNYEETELAMFIWIAQTLGKLISFISRESHLIEKANISKALNLIIHNTYKDNIAAFSRAFGLPKNTVWMWCKGKTIPELRILARICYCLDISLLDFIGFKTKAFESWEINIQKLPTTSNFPRKSPKKFNYETVESYLRTILNNADIFPPTMKEIAETLGLHRRTLSGHFPTLCKAISAKRRCHQKLNTARRIEECCNEIEQAVLKIYQSGEYPSEERVSQLISQPGYFRYKEVRGAWKKAILDLKI